MESIANALIISNDPSITKILDCALRKKKLNVECSLRLRNSSTIKKFQMSDLIIIDLINPSKNLPILLSLLENSDHQPIIVVVTVAEIFRIIWRHLEKCSYFLIIKPCNFSLTSTIMDNALEKMEQRRKINATGRNAKIVEIDHERVSNLELSPKQLLFASAIED